jgi:L-sorbose 1-phosphate reductase
MDFPTAYRRWHLYGAGIESVKLETVPFPTLQPDELLVRHDACGICFSDIKIINLGGNHPRLTGRDLKSSPVVMGHEVTLTVIGVGENRKAKFSVGQRFIVQADVYYQAQNLAYGYALTGGMSQFGIVGKELLDGDEGCYLLPISETSNDVEGALVEPWACVEAAYRWTHNLTSEPAVTITTECSASEFEALAATLTKNSTALIALTEPLERLVSVDIGRVHYDGHAYVSTTPNQRNELLGAGVAWFVGAAGPMGMMHTQRALALKNPPKTLLITDRHDSRLAALEARFGAQARSRGVDLVLVNVKENPAIDFAAIAPNGFDDIVVMVPSIEAIEESFPRLAQNGILNVFAGVARGTMARLPMADIALKNCRIVGTSGSSIADMEAVRDKLQDGTLATGDSLAAIGGLEAFADGLDAVKSSRFPGKTVIFPQLSNLPLTALTDLEKIRPDVFKKLRDGQFWTTEAEKALLGP